MEKAKIGKLVIHGLHSTFFIRLSSCLIPHFYPSSYTDLILSLNPSISLSLDPIKLFLM